MADSMNIITFGSWNNKCRLTVREIDLVLGKLGSHFRLAYYSL